MWEQNRPNTPKTSDHARTEGKTSQQLSASVKVCKTSTPGSNPGGASNFAQQF
jgi:hypothetical protein